jgi:hypothetical protein
MREPFVFYCEGGCHIFVLANLDTSLNGEHVIVCPKCHHRHYRKVENGQITDFRHSRGDAVDTIEPMPSAAFPSREEAMKAIQIDRDPFMMDLWVRKAQDEGWKQ